MSNKMFIREYEHSNNSYEIRIDNIRLETQCFLVIEKIVQKFLNKRELFFGFYRVDGINIPHRHFKLYKNMIKDFFSQYGELKEMNEYLSIAKVKSCDLLPKILPFVFDYYLEIILFNPKINWNHYATYYLNFIEHTNADYIINDYAEFLFSYSDSSDFSVYFNQKKHSKENIKRIIIEVIQEFQS